MLALTLLGACSGPELSTIAAIKSDIPNFLNQEVSLSGTVIKHDNKTTYVWIGAASYFNLDDGTGHMNIWYSIGMRCSPRIGSQVKLNGKVIKPDEQSPYIFSALSVSIESSPPLA